MSNIQGKVVVITGASGGLGEATARHLAAKGAKVLLGARRMDRLEAIVADIERAGGQAAAMKVDVTKRCQGDAFAGRDREVRPHGRAREQRRADGPRAALPVFERQKGGHIINIASVAGHKITMGGAVYCATKHAVRAILRRRSARGRWDPHDHHLARSGPVGAAAWHLRPGNFRGHQGVLSAAGDPGGLRGAGHRPRHRAAHPRGHQRILLRPTMQEL